MSNLTLDDLKEIYQKNYDEKCKLYPDISQKDVLPKVNRIIVLGDLHGDFDETIKCLKLAKLVRYNRKNDTVKWIGGDTVLVQVGDQIDRCRELPCSNKMNNDENSDIKILKLFTDLHKQAIASGGAVYSVIGNHELMNVDGRMDYVSLKNYQGFEKEKYNKKFLKGIPDEKVDMEARKWAFEPGNPIAEFLACTRKLALKIGDSLFVHAGILPQIADKYPNIGDLNKILALYLFNELEEPDKFADIFGSDVIKGKTFIGQSNEDVCNGHRCHSISPLWTREIGNITEDKCEDILFPTLEKYGVKRMIVGHTPQLSKGINSKCNNGLWFVDYGLSKAFDIVDINISLNGKRSDVRGAQVLQIIDDKEVTILTET